MVLSTKQQQNSHFPVKLLGSDTFTSDTIRNIGVFFGRDFNFSQHISQLCQSCFYHMRVLRRIRRHIFICTAKIISTALISSRLDYCNSLLNNIAKKDLAKLQLVQNYLERVVLGAPRFSPLLPLLKQLPWLPVSYRINFKLSTLICRALTTQQPPYLVILLHLSNIPRQLKSSISQQMSKTKLNLWKHVFLCRCAYGLK